jgi:hypothetical protein
MSSVSCTRHGQSNIVTLDCNSEVSTPRNRLLKRPDKSNDSRHRVGTQKQAPSPQVYLFGIDSDSGPTRRWVRVGKDCKTAGDYWNFPTRQGNRHESYGHTLSEESEAGSRGASAGLFGSTTRDGNDWSVSASILYYQGYIVLIQSRFHQSI